jgi:hypothetical protein
LIEGLFKTIERSEEQRKLMEKNSPGLTEQSGRRCDNFVKIGAASMRKG